MPFLIASRGCSVWPGRPAFKSCLCSGPLTWFQTKLGLSGRVLPAVLLNTPLYRLSPLLFFPRTITSSESGFCLGPGVMLFVPFLFFLSKGEKFWGETLLSPPADFPSRPSLPILVLHLHMHELLILTPCGAELGPERGLCWRGLGTTCSAPPLCSGILQGPLAGALLAGGGDQLLPGAS